MFDISTQSILCIIATSNSSLIHPHTALTAFRMLVHPPEWLFIEIQFARQSSAKRPFKAPQQSTNLSLKTASPVQSAFN